jgi:hypothetical protein
MDQEHNAEGKMKPSKVSIINSTLWLIADLLKHGSRNWNLIQGYNPG